MYPEGLVFVPVVAEWGSADLLVHINEDCSLVKVDTRVITANSSYFAIGQGHIRIPNLLGTTDYTADTTVAVCIRLCLLLHLSYCHHTARLSVNKTCCCRNYRIWFCVVGAPENYQLLLLLVSCPGSTSHDRMVSPG